MCRYMAVKVNNEQTCSPRPLQKRRTGELKCRKMKNCDMTCRTDDRSANERKTATLWKPIR